MRDNTKKDKKHLRESSTSRQSSHEVICKLIEGLFPNTLLEVVMQFNSRALSIRFRQIIKESCVDAGGSKCK